MGTPDIDDLERLQDLVADMDDIKGFLDGMTALAACTLSRMSGARVECAVTLQRRKRPDTVAGSSADALLLDGIEHRLGDGPCLQALRTGAPVLMGDLNVDPRWPVFRAEMIAKGFRSTLGIPLDVDGSASAVLNFFATEPGHFTDSSVDDAARFAEVASRALRLGLRIAAAELRANDLEAAMDSRTSIDLARGILMAQNRCTPESAFEILSQASSHRNRKLRDIAEGLVAGVGGAPEPLHFDA
ncbi:GAF and ANTAR domain-containing protein [Pseudarthrobacter sp. J75]|uniref:GAF and ANTAR domain-containing protein n=1 Tax=unclassified Pseudarthrobacter TaxID=2647000 RepID=UPI002E806D55|nr:MULTISPECIES: GAF and ANTAR domain-containing protein [unclassified Pseudarthrobacter]MEE2522342.1 GAF and ANTAR domain-containing protein [Pseudarthrobacter sp. J47]MEE2528012.1 GAF and ANTAR domain-containing protein [Pseudarthrobacter sp. J75]MEE2568747.1 GAF and ANTAR domain-containing protein [Pseudarthrobacter sp. J64]